ncbi:unnamed protein product, partial [Mesorhabditis belari]|uniref:Uncharacterized protein n=1 Tax=Mesorhabditis belari TaxID=2138241 RepID=A0AAF3ENK0_9BILA
MGKVRFQSTTLNATIMAQKAQAQSSMSTGTKTSTYIATQWDDKFELLENVIDENSLCADVVVQLVMLRVLLFISDLHEENCGSKQ